VTWLSEDFERCLQADAMLFCDGLRKVKTQRRRRLVKFVIDRTYHHVSEGVRDKDELLRAVQADTEEEFRSLILLWIIGGVVQFIVMKILKHIWPAA
jgi:hypothetical protein